MNTPRTFNGSARDFDGLDWATLDGAFDSYDAAVARGDVRPYHDPVDEPRDRIGARPVTAKRASRFFSASDLANKPVPPREWLVPDFIPSGTVTLFGGDGGSGKSQIALQLACAAVAGGRWLGQPVTTGRALYLSAEDDADELHRRLNDVTREAGVDLDHLPGLTLRSFAGEDALLAYKSPTGLMASPLFAEVETAAKGIADLRLIVLDTLADLYPGNENDRAEVRQFVGLLRGLAIRLGCAVVLLSHPSLTGLGSGTGTSGSTAWGNSVRSRLYLERLIEDGFEADPDRRRLSVKKANYGRAGGEILMRWQAGVFVADAPSAPLTGLDRMAGNAKAERVFMRLLDDFTAQGRYVSASSGSASAPYLFAKSADAEGLTKRALHGAMEALFAKGVIRVGKHGRPSKERAHIERVEARNE